MSKLTLSATPETILMAKEYAAQHDTSVSALFARFIDELSSHQKMPSDRADETSTLSQLTGSVTLDKNESYDDLRRRAVQKRYGI